MSVANPARIVRGHRVERRTAAAPSVVVNESTETLMARILREAGVPEGSYSTLVAPTGAQLRMAEDGSLMAGYWLTEAQAKALVLPGGVEPAEMHMTLAYLGKLSELVADAPDRLAAAIHMFSLSVGSVEFRVSGVARFKADDTNSDKDVIYASIAPSPELDEFRWRICLCLEYVGLAPRQDYGSWVPHITLAYVEPDSKVSVKVLPDVEIMIDAVTTSQRMDGAADERMTYPLRPPYYQYGPSIMMSEPIKAMEPPATIPIIPVPGSYKHPVYGTINLTEERIANFVANFENGVYQATLPIDLEHETKLSGAAGWITGLVTNTDGSVNAVVDWTDRGTTMLAADRFQYISPEWYDEWTDPATSKDYSDVLVGAALCTRPFFKSLALSEGAPLAIAASEAMPAQHKEGQMPTENEGAAVAKIEAIPGQTLTMSDEVTRRMSELETAVATLTTERDAAKSLAEQSATQSKSLAEQVAAITAERRRGRYTDMATGKGGENDGLRWYGEPSKHVQFMEHIATTAGEDSEVFKDYVSHQNAVATALKSSNIMAEVGTGGSAPVASSAWDKVQAKAKSLRETDANLSEYAAVDRVLMSDRDLAREYNEERRANNPRR